MFKKLFVLFSLIVLTGMILPSMANPNPVPSFTTDLTRMNVGPAATMRTNREVTFEGQRQSLTELFNSEGESQNKEINYVDNSQNGVRNTMYTKGSYDRGVNESKTIYTDDLGRLHFFGKGNIIKE